MATPYTVPRDLNLQNIQAPALVEGYETARGNTDMAAFTRTADAYTNILNANRMQSLRERQFTQEMINADRNFQLARDQQEYNFQAGTRDFDLKKEYQQAQLRNFDLNAQQAQWALQIQKDDYNNAQEGIKLAPSWKEELDRRLGPSGAYGPDAENIMADFVLEKGVNPGYQKVLENMLVGYRQRAQNYLNNTLNKTIWDAKRAIGTNELGNLKFTDPNLPDDVGQVGGTFILNQLQRARTEGRTDDVLMYQAMLNEGLSDLARQKQARIQEEATLRASKYGAPVEQVDVKGGEISTRFGVPKTVRGSGTGAGGTGGGLKPTEDIAKGVQSFETQRDLKEEAFKRADEALQNIDRNSAGYAVAKAERDRKYSEFQTAQQIVENNARQLAGQPNVVTGNQVPTGTQAPTTTAPSAETQGQRRVSDYLPTEEQKKSTVPTSMTTPDAANALLSPQAQRLERGLQTVERIGEPLVQGLARTLVPAPIRAIPSTISGAMTATQTLAEIPKAVTELTAVRQLRAKAQKAAFARIDRGEISQENQAKAYNEELQKLIAEYEAQKKPTISVR